MIPKLSAFHKAVDSLEKALVLPKTDITRDANIQRFEFCVALAWKASKKKMGTTASAPKQVIREMAQTALIVEVEFWLEAIDMRNISSHTYNEDLANKVYSFALRFLEEVKLLRTTLDEY